MIIEFIKLRIRESTRSSVWDKNVVINIALALLMLYLVVCFLIVGVFLDSMLIKSFPGADPVELFNRVLLYYFGLELLIRFMMQTTPAMSITPFLHLPVRRSFLMHFLLLRGVVHPINYVSFLFFVPFAIRAVSTIYSGAAACWWLFSIFLMILFVIFANTYIKRQMAAKPMVSLGCGLALMALIVLDVLDIFSLSEVSSLLFGAALEQPFWILIPIALATSVYLLNHQFLMARSYPEEIDRTVRKKQVAVQTLGFMSRFGQIGELIGLELKLILRHKRTKSVLYIMPFFMLYGLLFYPNPIFQDSMMWLIFVGIFVTGMMMLAYGQFIVAWEGKYFDGILTREGCMNDYFRAKYYMMVAFCIVSYVLTTPYALFGMKFFWVQTACFLFNAGITTCIMLLFAQYNRKRIELTQGSAFSWQGTGAAQMVVMLPALLLPMLIAAIFNWVGLGDWGLVALAVLGIIGVLCHKWIIQITCRRFAHTKYAQAEGFRSN